MHFSSRDFHIISFYVTLVILYISVHVSKSMLLACAVNDPINLITSQFLLYNNVLILTVLTFD